MTTNVLVSSHAATIGLDHDKLRECLEACFACEQVCTACADACLSEDDIAQLAKCIRTDLDCADICATTGRVLSRHTHYDANLTRSVLEACAQACRSCGDECPSTPSTWTTAGSAPTPADVVSRPAAT